MSKKNLLNESTVRQFMKYANIGALTENFVSETYAMEEEEVDMPVDDMPVDDMPVDDVPVDDVEVDDVEVDDVEVDDVGAEPEISMSEEEALALADGLTAALTDLTGHEFTASPAPDAEEVSADVELSGDEGTVDDADAAVDGLEVSDEEEEVLEGVSMIDEEEIVNETLRRVTSRIKSMQKRDRLAESVANRIMKRLSKNK